VAVGARDHVWFLAPAQDRRAEQKATAAPAIWNSTKPAGSSCAWGGPAEATKWPDTEHNIAIDYKGNFWIGGSNPTASLPQGNEVGRHAPEVLERAKFR